MGDFLYCIPPVVLLENHYSTSYDLYFLPAMLKNAIQHIIDDSSFHLLVEPAATALQQAKYVAEWSSKDENIPIFEVFEERLMKELKGCLPSDATSLNARSFVSFRADICRNYHSLRTSSIFVHLWSEFIKSASTHAHPQPTFYQEVTDLLFDGIIASTLPVRPPVPSEAAAITCDDANIINYAAGYVCRKIHSSIHRSSRPDQAELLRCVKALLKEDDEEEAVSLSAAWVNEVDRGGLWHVREGTYMLFAAMEEEVREHFRFGALEDSKERCREQLTTAVTRSDEVLFHWCMLTTEIEEIHAQTVLDMLVSLWITIRGFSFASSFLEMYKQDKKKGLQRSKALRKDII